ncbi:hypothetical protein KBTX_02749 [wastewater metagenome]|uniref:HEPN AbiU2-like domain-containing protein n=2 Tax=unclassified sequences TaxID=12908 RepID=A0A5B8RCU5_9ZZZZ|nr:hypothetical protein [Arhodomonas sp. KWT]QEA06411.1 hypothetical protein KBTEX_02749 [uncultured organism]
MDSLDEIINAEAREPKTFHPVHERGQDAWFPGNEAASLLIHVNHIWEDLYALLRVRAGVSDAYTKKLFLRYAVIEVRSLIQVFDRMQVIVMQAPTFDPRERHGWRELTTEEKEQAKELFKPYSEAKKAVSDEVRNVRNAVCAHRENLDWQSVMSFWDAITPELIRPILNAVPAPFNFLKELDLYEWNRTPRDGTVEFIGPMIRPEYFEDDRRT